MVKIPAGSFSMGCDQTTNKNCPSEELPIHSAFLPSYLIDQTEVTVNAYSECIKEGSCALPQNKSRCNYFLPDRTEFPVNCITWEDAQNYCRWMHKRLPRETEWEKAARGDIDKRPYPWGYAPVDCSHANINGCLQDMKPVGSTPLDRSIYGALDMAGNISEWTSDWYNKDYREINQAQDPHGAESGWGHLYRKGTKTKVIRGGAFELPAEKARVTSRLRRSPVETFTHVGFRCVKDLTN